SSDLKPIIPCEQGDHPEPGITQCFLLDRKVEVVDGRVVVLEPDLENWFHFPGTVAVALTGWFQEYACVMRKYNHLSISGLFVPTKVRPKNRIRHDGSVDLELDAEEFELLLRGIERIGRIYLAAATPENGVTLHLATKAMLLDACGRPVRIRTYGQLRWAIAEIRKRGPAFVNLLTSHPQGGNCLGSVVDPATFRLNLCDGRQVENLRIVDGSIFPAGCEINPQLTIKALAHFAADRILGVTYATAGV
ncbi:MAG: GMC family oxidoreductase, partial [Planctomycetes bacterium]|nr:GMC family oxidoreductase [Planctomycetota bacterium]